MRKENKMVYYKTKDKEDIQFPFYLIEGKEEWPTICITAGIHGCEYASVMAAIRLYKNLDPNEVKGNIKIIPIVNLPAFKSKTMFRIFICAFINLIIGYNHTINCILIIFSPINQCFR